MQGLYVLRERITEFMQTYANYVVHLSVAIV